MRKPVFSKAGTIAHCRWVRFTGKVVDGAYEVEVPGPGRRAHALLEPHPKGAIGPIPAFGFAETLGPVLQVEAGAALAPDQDVSPQSDGTVIKASVGDKRCVGVVIVGGAKGTHCHMMLRWAGKP